MSTKIYVGNLSFNTSAASLEQLFSECGTVESTRIIEDRNTGHSRGFGFIEMTTPAECESAIATLNGRELDGRALNVNAAKPQDNRSSYGDGKSGYGSSFAGPQRAYNKSW